jgi:threonine synthase
MNYLQYLECSKCRDKYPADKPQTICKKCNAPLIAVYDLEKIKEVFSEEALKGRRADMWRYMEFLPVEDERNIVSLGEGFTPIHRLDLEICVKNLYMKDDGIIPTGTFKARGMAMAVSKAKELGIQRLALPSAGNAAGAAAVYGAKAGIETYVIMPADAPLTCKLESHMAGAKVYLVKGLISDAGKIVSEGMEKFGWFDLSTMKEPYRLEGKKTMGFEIAEQVEWELPDVILYPTGGGTGLIGMWKAFKELREVGLVDDSFPRMVSVQAEGCAPIVKAYKEGKRESEFWEGANTLAGGIRVPKAFADFMILDVIYESGGSAVAVSDKEIIESSRELAKQGFFVCPEGASTLAGLKLLIEDGEIDKDERVLLYNTGSGIKYTDVYSENIQIDFPIISSAEDIKA